jgi:small subunit ribosomal protein S16
MAVKIRLARRGRKKKPFYHIVAADARSPRDGKFIEKIGSYNPLTVPATILLDVDKAYDWLDKGAIPTDTVNAILKFKGVLLKKHLQLGVKKGAITQEVADEKLATWVEAKEAKVSARKQGSQDKMTDFRKVVSGVAKAKPVAAAADEDRAAFLDKSEEE